MRPYILAETNWKNLKASQIDLAILPWGATEAHNYHLPYSTDNIEAEQIIYRSAEIAYKRGAKLIVLPTIPFGVNTGQSDIMLNMNLNPSTQFSILKDIIQVLDRQGIRKFLIFNSHGGNEFKPILREMGLLYPKMFLGIADFYNVLDKKDYFELDGDHADEMETSLMLYLRPDLVLEKTHWGKGSEKKINLKHFHEKWAWAERKWSKITTDTGIGSPEFASREKGERFFQDITKKIGNMLYELCTTELGYL